MDYKKIKNMLLEIQEMMRDIPQDCKGNSDNARLNRKKYLKIKRFVGVLIEIVNS